MYCEGELLTSGVGVARLHRVTSTQQRWERAGKELQVWEKQNQNSRHDGEFPFVCISAGAAGRVGPFNSYCLVSV